MAKIPAVPTSLEEIRYSVKESLELMKQASNKGETFMEEHILVFQDILDNLHDMMNSLARRGLCEERRR